MQEASEFFVGGDMRSLPQGQAGEAGLLGMRRAAPLLLLLLRRLLLAPQLLQHHGGRQRREGLVSNRERQDRSASQAYEIGAGHFPAAERQQLRRGEEDQRILADQAPLPKEEEGAG